MTSDATPNDNLIPVLLGLGIFAWSALFVWQGLDFTDLGFSLATYQQFYAAPETNTYFMLNWLTAFLGHWVGETLGGTVVAYNLSASLTLALTGVIAYLGLRLVFGRSWALAGFVFVAFLFATKANGNWIDYNNLTALFYTLGAVSLFYGIQRERFDWILIAGLVLGANLFIRFPNLLGIGLVAAVLLQAALQGCTWSQALRWSLLFVLGYALGIALTAALILAHGHGDLYLQSLQGIFGKAIDDNSAYSGGMLIKLFIRDHLFSFVLPGLVVGTGLLILRVVTERPAWLRTGVLAIAALFLALAFYVIDSWTWAVPGLLYLGLLWIAFREWRARPQLVVLVFIALGILVLAPLGSGNGIRNAVYGQWLSLPLLLTWLWQGGAAAKLPFVESARAMRFAATTLTLTLVGYSLVSSWFYSYRDSPERIALTQSFSHPLLVGTHTTPERAQVVSELLVAMPEWVKPGETVAIP
ncbi:MAG: hypothetical protein EOM24_05680 [Chloroflexia bacterium]|nr:hypothetical protein [Chloroflexia bacterium]